LISLNDFWRFGIPDKYRAGLWPLAVQNKLHITKQLYRINLAEGKKRVVSLSGYGLDVIIEEVEVSQFKSNKIDE